MGMLLAVSTRLREQAEGDRQPGEARVTSRAAPTAASHSTGLGVGAEPDERRRRR